MIDTKELRNELLQGNTFELVDSEDNLIFLFIGHNKRFCLMLNGKVIKSTLTWKPVENKLLEFGELINLDLC